MWQARANLRRQKGLDRNEVLEKDFVSIERSLNISIYKIFGCFDQNCAVYLGCFLNTASTVLPKTWRSYSSHKVSALFAISGIKAKLSLLLTVKAFTAVMDGERASLTQRVTKSMCGDSENAGNPVIWTLEPKMLKD